MEYFDCTKDCKYCVAKLCEKEVIISKEKLLIRYIIKHKHNKNGKEI